MWEIKLRRSGRPEDRAAHLIATWDHPSTITNVSLEAGTGVSRTSFGGASRGEMAEWSKPIEGVFRWPVDLSDPRAILRWTDPDGESCQESVRLDA